MVRDVIGGARYRYQVVRTRALGLTLLAATALSACTGTESMRVDPPPIPYWVPHSDGEPRGEPDKPPSPYDFKPRRRYRAAVMLAALRIAYEEAEYGYRVRSAFGDDPYDTDDWVRRISDLRCEQLGCNPQCDLYLDLPHISCGTGLGVGTDTFVIEVDDPCALNREYVYEANFEANTLVELDRRDID